jgi:mercuric ion transport protein
VITAVCCFTPVLYVVLGVVGLAPVAAYLDLVLIPLLLLFLVLLVVGAARMRAGSSA